MLIWLRHLKNHNFYSMAIVYCWELSWVKNPSFRLKPCLYFAFFFFFQSYNSGCKWFFCWLVCHSLMSADIWSALFCAWHGPSLAATRMGKKNVINKFRGASADSEKFHTNIKQNLTPVTGKVYTAPDFSSFLMPLVRCQKRRWF